MSEPLTCYISLQTNNKVFFLLLLIKLLAQGVSEVKQGYQIFVEPFTSHRCRVFPFAHFVFLGGVKMRLHFRSDLNCENPQCDWDRSCDSVVNKTKTKPLCLHLIKSKPEVYVPRLLYALKRVVAVLVTIEEVENASILV